MAATQSAPVTATDKNWCNDFVRNLNEAEQPAYFGWVDKVRRDGKKKHEPRLLVITAYRLCLIKKSGEHFTVRKHCHLSEMICVQQIDLIEICVTFQDGYEIGLRSDPDNIHTVKQKLWTFWGFINKGLPHNVSCRWIDRDQQSLVEELQKQAPAPGLSLQQYLLNSFKSYCSFHQFPYEAILEGLRSQLDLCARREKDFSIDTRKLCAQHLTFHILKAVTHSSLLCELHLHDFKMDHETLKALVECCRHCRSLRVVRLHNVGTFSETGSFLTRVMEVRASSTINGFHLEHCKIGEKGLNLLKLSFQNYNRHLAEISLVGLSTGVKTYSKLISFIPNDRNHPLQKLDLSCNELGSRGTRALLNRFNGNTELHTLNLSTCQVDMDELLNGLKNFFTGLEVFNLSHNGVNEAQGLLLASLISRRKNLTDISLVGCGLEGLTVAAICASMLKKQKCNGLVKVDLSQNHIGGETAILIASLLSTSNRLESLKLNYCDLGHEGMGFILNYASQQTHLKDLQLNRNVRIEQWGQGQHSVSDGLINVIQNCPNIESLCIRGDAANGYAIELERFLQQCSHTTLHTLDISGNALPVDFTSYIKTLILENTNLSELHWDRNNLSVDGLAAITHALSQNSSLQLIEFPISDFSVLMKGVKGNERNTEDLKRKKSRFIQTRYINKHHQGFSAKSVYTQKEILDRLYELPLILPRQIERRNVQLRKQPVKKHRTQ